MRGYCRYHNVVCVCRLRSARASRTRSAFHVFKNTTTTKKKKTRVMKTTNEVKEAEFVCVLCRRINDQSAKET